MKTMEETIRERMLEIAGAQLRALQSALPGTHRAEIVLTITPQITVTSATVRPIVQRGWYDAWHDLPKRNN